MQKRRDSCGEGRGDLRGAHQGKGAQFSCRALQRLPHSETAPLSRKRIEEYGDGDLDDRPGCQASPGPGFAWTVRLAAEGGKVSSPDEVWFAAEEDRGADVFPAVDAIARGPDDLGHVRPHGVKLFARERPTIPLAGDGDLPGLRLLQ
jgi:hypothetical protein